MLLFSTKKKLKNIRQLQKNFRGNAYIANELESRLLEHLPPGMKSGRRLDILRECTPEMILNEKLPYQDASFDYVIAHLVPLWQTDIVSFFQEIRRILMPNGVFLFSSFGVATLQELKKISAFGVHPFLDMHDMGDALLKAQFQQPVVDMELLQFQYDSIYSLFADLKKSGLRNCQQQHIELSRETVHQWEKHYMKNGEIIATFEVIYGYALGKSVNSNLSNKIEISVDSIRKKN